MRNLIFYPGVPVMADICLGALGSEFSGYLAEYQPFEKGVAAEPVCAVQASGSDLATGVKIFDACFCRCVSLYAANHIVGAGSDWD